MSLTTDSVDCATTTDTIIATALEIATHSAPGSVIHVPYSYPDASTHYQMIAMSLSIKAAATGRIRYEQTLHGIHTFTTLS
jgi:hypothetical protein